MKIAPNLVAMISGFFTLTPLGKAAQSKKDLTTWELSSSNKPWNSLRIFTTTPYPFVQIDFDLHAVQRIDHTSASKRLNELNSPDIRTRLAAAKAFSAEADLRTKEVLPLLLEALGQSIQTTEKSPEKGISKEVNAYLRDAIIAYGPTVWPNVRKAAQSDESTSRLGVIVAAYWLRQSPKFPKDAEEEYWDIAQRALKDKDPLLRLNGVRMLWCFRKNRQKEVMKTCVDGLKDTELSPSSVYTVAANAAEELGVMGSDAKSAIPELLAASRDPNDRICINCIQALVKIAAGDEAATKKLLPIMIELMKDPKRPRTQRMAMAGVGSLGHSAQDAIPVLIELIEGKIKTDDESIPYALGSLGQFGPEAVSAVPAIIQLLKRNSSKVTIHGAIAVLGEIGPGAKAAIPELQRIDKEMPRFRNQIHRAKQKISP